jgi:hypothetical protein
VLERGTREQHSIIVSGKRVEFGFGETQVSGLRFGWLSTSRPADTAFPGEYREYMLLGYPPDAQQTHPQRRLGPPLQWMLVE